MSDATDDRPSDPDHEAWLRAKIEKTLRAKAEDRMGYTPLDEVIAEYGPERGFDRRR